MVSIDTDLRPAQDEDKIGVLKWISGILQAEHGAIGLDQEQFVENKDGRHG